MNEPAEHPLQLLRGLDGVEFRQIAECRKAHRSNRAEVAPRFRINFPGCAVVFHKTGEPLKNFRRSCFNIVRDRDLAEAEVKLDRQAQMRDWAHFEAI